MRTQRTSDITVSDILLSHIRQNATLPMAWSIEEGLDRSSWVLSFEYPNGAGTEEIALHSNTRWLGVINTIQTVEGNYRALENSRLGLPSSYRRGVDMGKGDDATVIAVRPVLPGEQWGAI